jgi:hypothetical protein
MWSIRHTAMLAAGMLLLAGGTVSAQPLEVNVPFPFVVRGHTLPAGHYRIERDDRDDALFVIQGDRGTHGAAVVLTEPAGGHDPAASNATLTFKRVENTYVLDDVWEGADSGYQVIGVR